MWPTWRENRPFALGLLILIAYASVFFWVKTGQAIKQTEQIGKPEPVEHTIIVDGIGKVSGEPDIATIIIGIETRGDEVASAQEENTTNMNALIETMKTAGIPAADLQTTYYNVWQDQPWNPDTQAYELGQWIVSQTLTIKVRDTSRISTVLQLAGQNGATNISGPSFEVDDPSNLKAEAREKAIADAKAKAATLAQQLGVTLGPVTGFSETLGTNYPIPFMAKEMAAGTSTAPSIEPGQNEVEVDVSLTFTLVE